MRKWMCLAGIGMALGMLLPAIPAYAAEEKATKAPEDIWSYNDYEDGTVSVTLLDKTLTEAEVPAKIDGKTVTMVEVECFIDCTELVSVKLPETITVIDDYAFYNCTALESVNIPAGMEKIGFMAFYGCAALQEMHIPAAVSEIEEFAFEGCNSLAAVEVSDGNKSYVDDDGVLYDYEMTTLILYPSAKMDESYTIPESCTRIEDYAFIGNTHLKSVSIDSITEIGRDAFYYCTALEQITIPDAVTTLDGSVFGNCQSLVSVKLPANLQEIGNSCFYNCFALTELDIPESVTSIMDYAFFNCPLLKEIRLTKTTTEIGKYALGFYSGENEKKERVPGFQVDTKDDTAAYAYCVENSIKCTGGVTQGTVFIYIILGVVVLVIAITIALIVMQKKIQKRYELN